MYFTVEHIGLAARDTMGLKDWYVEVLGAREVFTDGKSPPAFLLETAGGLMIEIYPGDSRVELTADNKLAGWRHLAMRVDSIETARAELARRGVTVDEPIKPAGGGGRVLFFKDCEGNLLHLVERSEGPVLDRKRHESTVQSAPPQHAPGPRRRPAGIRGKSAHR